MMRYLRRRRKPDENTPDILKPASPGSTVAETVKTAHDFREEGEIPDEPNGPQTSEDPPVDDYQGPPDFGGGEPGEVDDSSFWGPLPDAEPPAAPTITEQLDEVFDELEGQPMVDLPTPKAPEIPAAGALSPPWPTLPLEERLLSKMRLGTKEQWEGAIAEGRALKLLDWNVYKVHSLVEDTRRKKGNWKEFLSRLKASAAGYLDGREAAVEKALELLKVRLMETRAEEGGNKSHDTPGGVRATLVTPSMNGIKITVDTGPLYQDASLAKQAETFPFVKVKREFVVDKPALKAWVKAQVDRTHPLPAKGKASDEVKAERIGAAFQLLNSLPICTAEMPSYGLKLTARGFDPFTQLGHYLGDEDATELLDGVFNLEEGDGNVEPE